MGPNNALQTLEHAEEVQINFDNQQVNELSPPRKSSSPRPTVRFDSNNKKNRISRGSTAKMVGVTKTVAKFKQIQEKVNKNKMPSVIKFRRQLQAAAEATQANKPQIISTPQILSSQGPIRIEDPHNPNHHIPFENVPPVMVEDGGEFMRHVMEDVIKANRKFKYFKNQVAHKTVGGLRNGEITSHKALVY